MKKCTQCSQELPYSNYYFTSKGTPYGECKCCRNHAQRAKKYNLTVRQLNDLLKTDVCAICDTHITGKKKHVDHCHKSGQVRGILCRDCNLALGLVKDNPDTLISMITYLGFCHNDFG